MAKKTIKLFTPYAQRAALAEPRPVRRLRVTPTSRYGRQVYYLDNWLPVPAWTRRLDGWSVRAVVGLAFVAMAAAGAAAWWLLRFLGRAR